MPLAVCRVDASAPTTAVHPRRSRMSAVALVVAAAVTVVLGASGSALATTGHSFADQFGAAGNSDGEFAGGPSSVAVLQASGDVFASDPGHTLVDGTPDPRIERFDAAGVFVSAFPVGGTAYTPGSLAIDPAGGGAVYVSAVENASGAGTVFKYSAMGVLDSTLDASTSGTTINGGAPVAVDPVDGKVYVAATAGGGAQVVDVFDSSGVFVSSFDGATGRPDPVGFTCIAGLAVDDAHRLYVLDPASCGGANRIDRYTAAGSYVATVDDGSRGGPTAVAVDPTSGEVFVGEAGGAGFQIAQFSAGGAALGQITSAATAGSMVALAVSHGSGTIYSADSANSVVERFTAFDGPTATTTAASPIGSVSATLNGTVDPGGSAATYHFEWGTDTSYGTSTPDTSAGSGTGAVPAPAAITGLVPNTTYHYRIVGSNSSGTITGGDLSFTTAAIAPTVDDSPAFASAISATGARIHGTVNPHNSPTTFHVDYGATTAYGSTAPQPDGDAGSVNGDTSVVGTLTDLQPGTTYHFRITADNGTGGAQHGADGTFVTAPGAVPGATDVTAAKATLSGTINPHGAATTYHFNYGPSTNYGVSTAEADGGSGNGDQVVTQSITGLEPSTTYHVQVVATTNGETRTGADGTFTTAEAPTASVLNPTGVSINAATLAGSVDTYGLAGTYRFDVASLDSSYAVSTDVRSIPAGGSAQTVTAPVSGLPAGQSFRVQLVVISNDATSFSDQITFATAPVAAVIPAPPGTSALYGCAAPTINTYNGRPKPGDTITITGADLGVGGTVALGAVSFAPADWSATGFTVQIPDDASGTLPLTVNCGQVSNTIAIAIYHQPDNTFTITKTTVTATTATLTLKLPGVGKIETSGNHTAAANTTITKAGTTTIKIKLSSAGKTALRKAKNRKLTVTVRVRYTPAGGTVATLTKTLTFKTASNR